MEYNVFTWSEDLLGHRLSLEEFLSSPYHQDILAGSVITGMLDKYTLEEATSIWFSGQPDTPGHVTDANGMSVEEYVDMVITQYNNL